MARVSKLKREFRTSLDGQSRALLDISLKIFINGMLASNLQYSVEQGRSSYPDQCVLLALAAVMCSTTAYARLRCMTTQTPWGFLAIASEKA
jgi:hypothetical protein